MATSGDSYAKLVVARPTPQFGVGGYMIFSGSAYAGSNVVPTVNSAAILYVYDTASLGNASMVLNPGPGAFKTGGNVWFLDNSTAGAGTIVVNGGTTSQAYGGQLQFFAKSNTGNATIIANGGTSGGFGATVEFRDDSQGGATQLEVYGDASVTLANHNSGPRIFTIGSLHGDGMISEGSLMIGKDNLDSVFSGRWNRGNCFKIGRGTLTLNAAADGNAGYVVR